MKSHLFFQKAKRMIHGIGLFVLIMLVVASNFAFTVEKSFTLDVGDTKLFGYWNYYVPQTRERGTISMGKITFKHVNEVIIGGQPEYGYPIPDHPLDPDFNINIVIKKSYYRKSKKSLASVFVFGTRRRRIILNNPPVSSPWHLPTGVSYLTSLLKEEGHEVSERYGHLLGLEYVLGKQDAEKTHEALRIVRDSKSTASDWYKARKIFEEISTAIPTNDKFIVQRNNVLYVAEKQDGTISSAIETILKREGNMWYEYFKNVEIPYAQNFQPDLYGVSIAEERQLFPGLILASMVKDFLPNTKVIIGGNFWSRVLSAYEDPDFLTLFHKCCDGLVYKEGFIPMLELVRTLDPSIVSGTLWSDGIKLHKNSGTEKPFLFSNLPAPSYDGGAMQWSPNPVYPFYTTSNCFMRCNFCSISSGSDTFLDKPRIIPPDKIVSHMIHSGGHRFDFFDEMVPVSTQLKIGEILNQQKYDATWYCYATIGDAFIDPQMCHKLYQAGCRGVQLGLESLESGTLALENKKWNHPDNYGVILDNLRNAGIQTHIFILVGLPTEPLHRTLKWLWFLEEHGRSILTIKAGRYRPSKGAPDVTENAFTKITLLPDVKKLHLNRDFQYLEYSNKKVDALRDLLEEACRRHWAYNITSAIPWWTNRGNYTWEELESMSAQIPKDPSVEHIQRTITKVNTIIREELGKNVHFKTFEELVNFSKTI